MNEIILKKLYEVFKLSSRKGQGGMTFKYVPNEDVINRMNKVFSGNWSTNVKFRETMDDQVILEVEVSIIDPDTQLKYSHTGFGSQQIMRYNSGTNQGKIIDGGNAYKGALAKAIVNACTRWGVGLFKENNPFEEGNNPTPAEVIPEILAVPSATPIPQPESMSNNVTPQVAVVRSEIPVVSAPIVNTQPVSVEPSVPVPNVPIPAPAVAETVTTFPPPMTPEQPVSANISVSQEMPLIPTPEANVVPTTPDLPFSKDTETLSNVGISDVQRVALNGILVMNNVEYKSLGQEAFTANSMDKPLPKQDDLNYEEAVAVIKYGNAKFKKNR